MEIHKPKPVHSWREFLKEYAIIVLGVLTALVAEQTVEFFHHLNQLRTARQELTAEFEENRNIDLFNKTQLNALKAELAADMVNLIGARESHSSVKSPLNYKWRFRHVAEAAWQVAHQNGSLELMPHSELQHYAIRYDLMDAMTPVGYRLIEQMTRAAAIARRHPKGEVPPQDLDELITATSDAQGVAENLGELMDSATPVLQTK